MLRSLIIILKIVGVLVVSVLVASLATDSELQLHLGTFILVLSASVIFFFARTVILRVQAFAFLLLAIATSHAVDLYFWSGVWNHGYPWPYSSGVDGVGVIGSISPFVDEVATVCFSVLGAVAVIAITCHLICRKKGRIARQVLPD